MDEFLALLLLNQRRNSGGGEPIEFDQTAILAELADIKASLADLAESISNISIAAPEGILQIIESPISPLYAHTGTWDTQLTSLNNITDGNNASITGYGQMAGGTAGDQGNFEIDLGQTINSPYSIFEFLIGIQNSNGQLSYWGLEFLRNADWENLWGIHRTAPHPSTNTNVQIFKRIIIEGSWQKIRFNLRHTGSWAPRLGIYSLKVYKISS